MCDRKPPASQITITQSIREQCDVDYHSDDNQINAEHKRNVKVEQLEHQLKNSRQLYGHSKPSRNKDIRLGQILHNVKREREELSDSSIDSDFVRKERVNYHKRTDDNSLELNKLSKRRRLRRARKEKEKLLSKTNAVSPDLFASTKKILYLLRNPSLLSLPL